VIHLLAALDDVAFGIHIGGIAAFGMRAAVIG
jgi:hypothetical protein